MKIIICLVSKSINLFGCAGITQESTKAGQIWIQSEVKLKKLDDFVH